MPIVNLSLDTIVKFARRKGFVYQSSEIYGGFAATYDYGQMGILLKKNIEALWRYWNITSRTDMLEIEGAIFLHPKVWEASGHIGGFSDLLVEDTVTHKRYRADHLIEDAGVYIMTYDSTKADYINFIKYQAKTNLNKIFLKHIIFHFNNLFPEKTQIELELKNIIYELLIQNFITVLNQEKDEYLVAESFFVNSPILENAGALSPEETDQVIKYYNLKSPDGNQLSKAKKFNLLVKTHLGPVEDETSIAYLKGESCQNIYVNWKQVQETSRKKLPFGIAQIGKAFRNEITVKQYMFRTREFEQMDVQFFVKPGDESQWYEYWKQNRADFYTKGIGFTAESIRWRQHELDERAFYALDAWDVEFRFGALGYKEIEGVHNRTSYDTDQHSKFSGADLSYLDPETNEKYNPYIVEMSGGFNRLFLATLFEFYDAEKLETAEGKPEDIRTVLRFPFELSPYKIAVLPLMKKDGMGDKATEIFKKLREAGIMADFDDAGSIGKRYRRQDENGTPWCITVDYDSLDQASKDYGTVTLRHRDTMAQIRVSIDQIQTYLNRDKFGK